MRISSKYIWARIAEELGKKDMSFLAECERYVKYERILRCYRVEAAYRNHHFVAFLKSKTLKDRANPNVFLRDLAMDIYYTFTSERENVKVVIGNGLRQEQWEIVEKGREEEDNAN